ncbi:MAG: hypothetical protein MJ102_00705 [Clostridia bacterium]|nr:hypothetical protein [Clostridia bacterium]
MNNNTLIQTPVETADKRISPKKLVLRATAVFIAALIPVILVVTLTFALPKCFDETFDAALSDKFSLLNSIDEPKIIVIGGSSVAFGLDSKALSDATGYPVVNFGLYAALGTKIMLDLSRSNINEGDIVVLSPEIEIDTLSLFFNADETWRAIDADAGLLRYIGKDNYSDLAGSFIDYVEDKWHYAEIGTKPSSGKPAYTRDAFNEYGDIIYPRPTNTMGKRGYDRNNPIRLKEEILGEDFIDYLEEYVNFCEKKGAKVVFSYPPMNKNSLEDGSKETIAYFQEFLASKLPCRVISDINDYIMPPEYFYDTNFHLNDKGVPIRTAQLAEDITQNFLKDNKK